MKRRDFTKMSLIGGSLLPFMQLAQAVQAKDLEQRASDSINSSHSNSAKSAHESHILENSTSTPFNYASAKAKADQISHDAHMELMNAKGVQMMGEEKIAMLLYPEFTALDLVGPQFLFASMMGAEVHIVSPTNKLEAVKSDTGLEIMPTITLEDCPDNLDLLFLPGSASGVVKAMQNKPFIEFIRNKASTAKYVTSVCTGSLLLGKAGLLKGKKATSHWVTLDLLKKFGATPIKNRVVWDGNLISGGGITAGIDFGLEILAALRGKVYAQAIQLQLEYNPQPPFSSGSPETADPFLTKSLEAMFAPLLVDMENAINS